MGKWAAKLAEKTAAPPPRGTDKTDKRGLVSVLAVTTEGGADEIRGLPALALLAGDEARADGEAARFLDRRARLVRWGWAADDAERLAERLARRDREADPRVSCADCRHYRPGRCGNHRRAGLHAPELGRDLAAMLQRCPGFAASEGAP